MKVKVLLMSLLMAFSLPLLADDENIDDLYGLDASKPKKEKVVKEKPAKAEKAAKPAKVKAEKPAKEKAAKAEKAAKPAKATKAAKPAKAAKSAKPAKAKKGKKHAAEEVEVVPTLSAGMHHNEFRFDGEMLTGRERVVKYAQTVAACNLMGQKIYIIGCADQATHHNYNAALALRRAEQIKAIFLQAGLQENQLVVTDAKSGNAQYINFVRCVVVDVK